MYVNMSTGLLKLVVCFLDHCSHCYWVPNLVLTENSVSFCLCFVFVMRKLADHSRSTFHSGVYFSLGVAKVVCVYLSVDSVRLVLASVIYDACYFMQTPVRLIARPTLLDVWFTLINKHWIIFIKVIIQSFAFFNLPQESLHSIDHCDRGLGLMPHR